MTIQIDNLTNAQVIAIEDMLGVWAKLGSIGSSRWTKFFADGDGSFHPDILVNGVKPKRFHHPKKGVKSIENYSIDFDEIAWLLRDHKAEDLQKVVT